MTDLPPPRTLDQSYLAAILLELRELRAILDPLQEPALKPIHSTAKRSGKRQPKEMIRDGILVRSND